MQQVAVAALLLCVVAATTASVTNSTTETPQQSLVQQIDRLRPHLLLKIVQWIYNLVYTFVNNIAVYPTSDPKDYQMILDDLAKFVALVDKIDARLMER